MGDVFVIYGNQIDTMVQRLLAEADALNRMRPDDTVVIKPNLVVSRPQWAGVNTDPQVVEALVKQVKERGVQRVIIGDGSGMGYNATKAFKICDYTRLKKKYNLQLVDLERDRFIKKRVPIDGPFSCLEIAQTVVECDFLINVPVMKAHAETLITCSLKNLKGVMPRTMKTAFHSRNLHRAIAQLASVVSPDLIIVDGIQGDLTSETGRTPVTMERILLGRNPVEVDSVVADTLGYAPRDIRHIEYSANAGLGNCDLEMIQVRSLNRPTRNERFTAPDHFSKRFPCQIHAEGACCTCMGNFIFALERLQEKRMLSGRIRFLIGQKANLPPEIGTVTVAVGQCAAKENNADINIDDCPPSTSDICRSVSPIT